VSSKQSRTRPRWQIDLRLTTTEVLAIHLGITAISPKLLGESGSLLLPKRATSKNPWINGSKSYNKSVERRLCIKCGHIGHIPRECTDTPIPSWEQSYLKEVVFGSSSSVNFAVVGYGDFDSSSAKPYGTYTPSSSDSSWRPTPASSSQSPPKITEHQMSGGLGDPPKSLQPYASSKSSSVGFSGLGVPAADVKAADSKYGEGLAANKQPRVEEELPTTTQQPTQPMDNRVKVKGQKKVGKMVEPQPLVGLFNDFLGRCNSPVSIRQVLQSNKVDMTWMDLASWSPAVCRELKRLCTRVAKKRAPKGEGATT
jgi:hypothetical protein